MKAIIAIMSRLSHLFDAFQFMGLYGSSSPSQLTTLSFGFSTLLFTSSISSSTCFLAVVIVGDEGGEGKVTTAEFEVNIYVSLVLNELQGDEVWTLVEGVLPVELFIEVQHLLRMQLSCERR